ncbi:MAG: hypothetical protein IKA05_00410 [Clostridia bacterium]|nr:hypothetical protein [Clostridia bacterium]
MKKFLSILLTVAMVLSMLCLPAVAAETDDDGYTLVSTFEELLAIKTADQKARLTKDIKVPTNYGTKIVDGVLNLTGQAGILQPGTFRAEWDGNGYEIDFSDITIKFTHSTRTVEEEEKDNDGAAVFFTTFVGKWKNITLTGLNIEANDNTVASCQAGIVSYKGPNGGASAENGFFENVRIEAEFTNSKMTKSMNFGSYIGLLDAAQSGAISFLNCSSDLTVNSEKGIGASGFVGAARSTKAGTLSFTNCTTSGNINTGAGRAAGFLLEAKDDQIVTFTNCVNAANITGGVVGGIMAAGAVTSGKTYTPTRTFKNCVNVGDLTGSSSTAGILANNPGSTQAKYTIDGCVNAGDITSSAQRAAGIVAHFASGTLDVDNCINFGDVDNSAEAATVAGHSTPQVFQAATIVCYGAGTTTVDNCVNFGSRSGWTVETTGETKVATEDNTPKMVVSGTANNLVDMTDANNQTTSVVVSSALLRVLEGARIRLANSAANGGIRYDIASNKALLDKLVAAGFTVELGSKMSTAEAVAETNYKDLASASSQKVAYAANYLKADGTYSAAAIGITNYATEYNCGGFITLTKGEGVSAVTYTIYTEAGSARSLQYIAASAMADDAANEDVDYSDYNELLATYKGDYELPTT